MHFFRTGCRASRGVRCHLNVETALLDSIQPRVVDWLLEQGFQIDEKFGRDACAPLFLAVARARSPRLASFLIECGASPDLKARDGITPRERASRKRDKRFATAMN